MTTTNEQRTKIIERIRALQAKSQDSSVTEAEAVAFAAKASDLIAQYNLTFTELEIKEEGYTKDGRKVSFTSGIAHPAIRCAMPIGKLYNCYPWRDMDDKEIVFFGTAVDTEQAHYLLKVCYNAIEAELKAYKKTAEFDYQRNVDGIASITIHTAFRHGMASRLIERIRELVKTNEKTVVDSGGTALVVARGTALKTALRATGIRLSKDKKRHVRDTGAMDHGYAAGDRASLSRGVNSSSGPILLGR